jgi:hypothetical protein
MARCIMTSDVRDLLTCFAAAIELDQIRVDALRARSLIKVTTTAYGACGAVITLSTSTCYFRL